jgi:hypothetical protein
MSSISQSAPWLVKGSIFIIFVLIDPVLSITWQNEVNVSVCNWSQLRGKSFEERRITRNLLNMMRSKHYSRYHLSRRWFTMVADVKYFLAPCSVNR